MAERASNPVTAYARDLVGGKIVAGKLQILAGERHLRDVRDGGRRGLRFDLAAAVKAIEFFRLLRHYKGEWSGQPMTLRPWQEFIVGSLWGWKRADGLRRFREAYEEVPRKNGKSTMSAGITLLATFFDDEPGAEGYCAATKKDQAKIVWKDAMQMVLRSPGLKKRIEVLKNNLHDLKTASKLEPLGADEDSTDGLNVHCANVDEVHAHKTGGMVEVLRTATGARRQPLINFITTAGYDRTSVCWQLHEYAVKVLEGVVQDDTFFALICAADPGDDWRAETTWQKANPNFGVSVKPDDLRRKAKRAEHIPAEQNAFRRKHLNEWTEQSTRAIDMEAWDACPSEPIELEDLEGRQCFAGLDMASTNDIAALALVFGPDEDAGGAFDVVLRFWIPRASIEVGRSKRPEALRRQLEQWAAEGWIEVTEGNVTDYDVIEAAIFKEAERFQFREFTYDRWGVTQLVTHLQNEWGEGEHATIPCVPVGQGYQSMSAPTKEFLRLVAAALIRHGGNPVLRWMVSNLSLRMDPAGNLKPDRFASGEKIDGVAAILDALSRAIALPQEGESDYDKRVEAGEDPFDTFG